jgi:hypothetical protein
MFTKVYTCTFEAVRRQDYDVAYFLQSIPVLGPIISVPTALVSGTMAIVKLAQSIFQKCKDGTPFFRSVEDKSWVKFPLESAIDLSIIFANNVINICTLGILNNILVCNFISSIKCGSDFD